MLLTQSIARKVVSWLFVALGTLPGIYGLVMCGLNWVPENHRRPDWLTLCLQAAGLAILGLVFLIASFAALRRRRRAGLALLVAAPIAVFGLAFTDAYFGVPFRGYDWQSPSLLMAMFFVCAIFLPFCALLLAARTRKRAIYLFLVLALCSGIFFWSCSWTEVILPRLTPFAALFLVFGAFWLGTDKLGWPPLVAAWPKSLGTRIVAISVGSLMVGTLVLAGTFVLSARSSYPWVSDCGESPLFARPLNSEHAVFTARAIRVGHATKISGRWAGPWAIGVVQERFWGLPWWAPPVVLLTTHPFLEGETYFVDGKRGRLLLTRFLPIVEAGWCTRTRPVADSAVELRLLREAPSANEVRIIGIVHNPRRSEELRWERARPANLEGMSRAEIDALEEHERYRVVAMHDVSHVIPGARIRVTRPSGETIVTANAKGIYEVAGRVADDYTLELLDVPRTRRTVPYKVEKKELIQKRLFWLDLDIFWNGGIEGRVRDVSGGPVQALLDLRSTDGYLSGGTVRTDESGVFRVGALPPNRYILSISP